MASGPSRVTFRGRRLKSVRSCKGAAVTAADKRDRIGKAGIYRRRRRLVFRAACERVDGELGALWITNRSDIRYLSGSTEGASGLLCAAKWAVLFTGKMFRVRAIREAPGTEIRLPEEGLAKEVVSRALAESGKSLGIQETVMTVAQRDTLAGVAGELVLKHIGDVVVECRAVKEEEEIRITRKAVKIAEGAFRKLIGQGAEYFHGRTENELAAELEYRMRLAGADRQGFPGGTIVASGPNSYNCHHVPGSRRVRPGEPVLFDWGAEVQGYRSDITRVVFAGTVPDKLREIYELVLRAHDAAVAIMRPGVRCHTVDTAARKVIGEAGYAEAFRHGLGHGIGLEIHERPGLAAKPKTGPGTALRKNMLITVEPGVYVEGIGGVRIEDDILITGTGHERLNQLPRTLDRMILR